MLDVLLDDVIVEFRRRDVEAPVRDEPPAIDRILAGLAQRDELDVALEVGEVELPGPAARLRGPSSRASQQLLAQRLRARGVPARGRSRRRAR